MILKELAYVVLAARDLDAWQNYATQVLGTMAAPTADGDLRIRIDERDARILIQPSDRDHLVAIGWLAADQDLYEQALAHAQSRGLRPVQSTADEARRRRVTAFFSVVDPAGFRHEIAWGPIVNFGQPFRSPAGDFKFHTGSQGMGHIVIGCEPDQYEATCRFMRESLSLKLSNFRQQAIDGLTVKMPISWFHCNNSRQHSLGLAACFEPGQVRHGCRHINLEVDSIDGVGMAYDRALRLEAPIARTLGRHVNDRAISFYVFSPSGFLFEYGCDAPARDWSEDIVYDEGGVGSIWGHQWVKQQ
jgi:3,4-dihydroxy-9,10-secoandrosta-1,3,5(10)-triene-9,17-dione 4,5-dioxygenase